MSIAKYELNCILADQIDLVKAQKDPSYRDVPANTSNSFKPRLFRHHNPTCQRQPRKAVDVFPRTVMQTKKQGFQVSPPPKNTFSAGGKSPENPVFKPFFNLPSVFLHFASTIRTSRDFGHISFNYFMLSHPVCNYRFKLMALGTNFIQLALNKL
ncbi:hypothetical protein [Petroclostridium xylanilyticum]|jgi:hypothetical protein|uniref:hypothetical protein n=1 Tax=Petroclostridium xylanilyticum TaxID=1792311 RepID=UPI0018E3D42F|nr:hypothetical protein [Petroclostridium xylanilyticum]